MKGKHAARAENRRQHELEADVAALRGDVGYLKDLLEQAEQRVRYVESLEKELAHLRTEHEGDKLFADTWDEVVRLRKVCVEWNDDYEAVLDNAGVMVRKLGTLLGWDGPTMHEFILKNAPAMLPNHVKPGSVSRMGVQNKTLDDDATRRIQIARGIRKLSGLSHEL